MDSTNTSDELDKLDKVFNSFPGMDRRGLIAFFSSGARPVKDKRAVFTMPQSANWGTYWQVLTG